jgi:catechol 2,3-dioxygenase-like lactoylglutathione lyase family enzyme
VETGPLVGFSHIQIQVGDLDESVAWYKAALGLSELRGVPGRYVTLHAPAGGFRVVLYAGGSGGARGSLGHVAFDVADLDALEAWAKHLADLGIAHGEIKANIAGHSLDLFDPDGNNIELISET